MKNIIQKMINNYNQNIKFTLLYMISLLYTICALSCSGRETIASVKNIEISNQILKYQVEIDKIYSDGKPDSAAALIQLLENCLYEQIAESYGIVPQLPQINKEANRISTQTKDVQKLARIKQIFHTKHNEEYLKYFVKPILVRKLLQDKYFYDVAFHREQLNLLQKTMEKQNRGNNELDGLVITIVSKESERAKYQNAIGKGILEDKYSYYFVTTFGDILKTYLVRKNEFTDWFEKEASKYTIEINDKNFKQKVTKRIKDSEYWANLIVNNQRN
jgi:hypothetical protein